MALFKDRIDWESLEYIIDHVFLPPQLPQGMEESDKNKELLQFLCQSSDAYSRNYNQNSVWPTVVKMLENFSAFESISSVSAEGLASAIEGMRDREAIGIHITSQNAGLVLRRIGDLVVFTSFEASPASAAVTGATGKLLISYPGPAIGVERKTLVEPTFLKRLSEFVEIMKRNPVSAASGKAQKAGETLQEDRESTHPMYISEMLTGILRGVGQEIKIERFMKRVADEVLWDNVEIPWRRTSLWLVVRVALQMVLGKNDYKSFMIFFMSQVLVLAIQKEVKADRLFVMNAKLARRVHKLGEQLLPTFALYEARMAVDRAYKHINEQWLQTQRNGIRSPWDNWSDIFYDEASFWKDTIITMHNSREYIKGLRFISCTKPERGAFSPNEEVRVFKMMGPLKMPQTALLKDPKANQNMMLADFERWVMESLDEWLSVSARENSIEACKSLGGSIRDYMEVAMVTYKGNPERSSIMVLTVMELWVALDKLVVEFCPLLLKYSPELNESYLCALLLPESQQRSRLASIEDYIKKRRSDIPQTSVSIFSTELTEHTFSICYSRSSDELVQLEKEIVDDATYARRLKVIELAQKGAAHENLLARIQTMSCDYFTHWRDGWTRHDKKCRKCKLVKEADGMKVDVHEWPLPDDPLESAAVIFELRCPRPFSIWREATFRILYDIFTPSSSAKPSPSRTFDNLYTYSGLKVYFSGHDESPKNTLNYTSMQKSFLSSHYRSRRLPATEDDIFVRNALEFGLYDTKGNIWTAERPPAMDCRQFCTFKLPNIGPYASLQYAVTSTSHTPNQVLAQQFKCHTELQMHEYVAFGLLRSGARIQWLNMLRELRSRTLTFSAEPVSMLYLQAAWQVGHPGQSQAEREFHIEPGEAEFGRCMILELENLLRGVEQNWQEVTTAQTMIVLAIQILAATKSEDVISSAVRFLREARRVCLAWTRELAEKLPECDPGEVRESQMRVIQMAATCRMTYGVEDYLLPEILLTVHDIAVYVECATTIHYNLPDVASDLTSEIRRLLVRDFRMAHAIEGYLRALVIGGYGKEIDLKPIWNVYERGASWSAMEYPNDRWVYSDTAGGEGRESQRVHYNLLSGELLVEGLPLGRMPAAYTSHSTYKQLFQQKVLNVYPSNMSGMIFQTRHAIYGHQVSFAMQEPEGELIIRTQREKDGVIHQFIPKSKLDGDFPANIISNYVFWLELPSPMSLLSYAPRTHGKIILRDRSTPWSTEEKIYISNSYDETKTRLTLSDGAELIDVRSLPAAALTAVLAPLEAPEFIQITYGMGIIRINLPRLKLDFSINRKNLIDCKQFPKMVIDEYQSIGTFIGLQNFLVVRQGPVRSVIIPHGKVLFEQQGNHTKVKIDITGMERVRYHVYTLDRDLGRVVGNGSLTSHLYKIYLHAVTSHCLPDPLTRTTGTEEALLNLRAAATKSFQRIDTKSDEAELFRLIYALTPIREYYPPHLKRMQQVSWIPGLPPLAQHEEFRKAVKEVSEYAKLLNVFEHVRGSILSTSDEVGEEDLAHRAAKRNAIFRTEQFGGSMIEGKKGDRIYVARDMVDGSVDEARVAHVSRLVKQWQGPFHVHPNLLSFLEEHGEVRGSVLGEEGPNMKLGYSPRWLDPSPAEVWLTLYNRLRGGSGPAERYDWLFLLTALAYSGKLDLRLIETLMAFGTVPAFKTIEPPRYSSYDLRHGYEPDDETLRDAIKTCAIDFEDSEESKLDSWVLESEQATQKRRSNVFRLNKEEQARNMARELRLSWPNLDRTIANRSAYPLYIVEMVLLVVEPCFENWKRNSEFRAHISLVQNILDAINNNQKPVPPPYHFRPCEYSRSRPQYTIRLSDLLTRPPPNLPRAPEFLRRAPVARDSGIDSKPKNYGLEELLRDFRASYSGKFQVKYTEGLEKSIQAFRAEPAPPDSVEVSGLWKRLKSLKRESESYMWSVLGAIEQQLAPQQLRSSHLIFQAGLWPRICPMLLLQQLATNCPNDLSSDWKKALTIYAISITTVQRLDRLIEISPKGVLPEVSFDFLKELENVGHQRWKPLEHPDWLLVEIENNLLIRPVQADIAFNMTAPPGNSNKIMQLCMGEGKTSVIVPIVAASLANTEKLVRVVVLKPLSGQMFQTLVQKLGGLVNRRIFFMPFSRGISMGETEIMVIKQLFSDCLKGRGILLVQPEHVLSFKLLGLEWLYNSTHKQEGTNGVVGGTGVKKYDRQVARRLLETQKWLDATARDILDESDEILNVKHELIYTIGNPVPIQNHPDRWIIIQEIFDLIKDYFKDKETMVQDFEMERHTDPTRFGSIRILNLDAGRAMLKEVAGKIIEDQLLTISFRLFPAHMRELATRFIRDTNMTEEEARPLLGYFDENSMTSDILYLLRGLIAYNILLFALKEKRWKVDYGLDLKRSLLAVPYRAKDSPSGKAEFSHPDVAISLTCLSYYYGGLDEEQLETCFRNLYKSDNPALQYERWIKGVVLPKKYLERLNGINLEDRVQWKKLIYPTFHFNKAVIDSYLSGVVFPKEAKEFPYKLSTSGWDIAAFKKYPTTGFSGTNDNRYLLPLSIEQHDTREQMNTNARVLSYLLQEGNNYKCISGGPNNDERVNVEQLLKILVKRPEGRQIQVLLDVGAQVLELKNHEVAEKWLSLVSDALAAVFFDDNDVLTVLTKDGNTEPLMVSAFADRLDRCLVYLDEAHTRGTDLKLPIQTRAAVTLGPNLTKDRLVQACMRMRKLGNGHSVLFCGPPEIDRKIKEIARRDNRDTITVRDVLFWCMEETCDNARKLLPIWAKQGINYQQHLKAWDDIGDGKEFPGELRERESKTLKEHYGFERLREEKIDSYRKPGPKDDDLSKILDKCKSLGINSFHGARMLEEQERELAHEVECERENQRPEQAGPTKHVVSDDLKQFILSGTVQKNPRRAPNIVPAFNVLERTSAKRNYEQARPAFSQRLLATMDFCRVVDGQSMKGNKIDDFLRPVNWILSSRVDTSILVIASPYEVSKLLPEIRKSTKVLLHMYSPQVTRATPSYDMLDFCTIPALPPSWKPDILLLDQLNLFAGQLYFRDYEAYERVCGFLGLYLNEAPSEFRTAIHSDGFVNIEDRERVGMKQQSLFTKSPVTLLRELIGFRRKGQSYIATHMGHIVHGRFLTEVDFEEVEVQEEGPETAEELENESEEGYKEGEVRYDEPQGSDMRTPWLKQMFSTLRLR